MAKAPKKKSNAKIGDEIESQVAGLLDESGWHPWSPERTASYGSKDVWYAFDLMALRADSRVLAAQTSVLTEMARRKAKVAKLILPIAEIDTAFLGHLAPQVWLYDKENQDLRVLEIVGRAWVEIGRCDVDGRRIPDYKLPWPLVERKWPPRATPYIKPASPPARAAIQEVAPKAPSQHVAPIAPMIGGMVG